MRHDKGLRKEIEGGDGANDDDERQNVAQLRQRDELKAKILYHMDGGSNAPPSIVLKSAFT